AISVPSPFPSVAAPKGPFQARFERFAVKRAPPAVFKTATRLHEVARVCTHPFRRRPGKCTALHTLLAVCMFTRRAKNPVSALRFAQNPLAAGISADRCRQWHADCDGPRNGFPTTHF